MLSMATMHAYLPMARQVCVCVCDGVVCVRCVMVWCVWCVCDGVCVMVWCVMCVCDGVVCVVCVCVMVWCVCV